MQNCDAKKVSLKGTALMVIETVFTLMCKDGGNLIISDAVGKGYCCKTVASLLEVVDV